MKKQRRIIGLILLIVTALTYFFLNHQSSFARLFLFAGMGVSGLLMTNAKWTIPKKYRLHTLGLFLFAVVGIYITFFSSFNEAVRRGVAAVGLFVISAFLVFMTIKNKNKVLKS
jgi:phosphatidylserine synthase